MNILIIYMCWKEKQPESPFFSLWGLCGTLGDSRLWRRSEILLLRTRAGLASRQWIWGGMVGAWVGQEKYMEKWGPKRSSGRIPSGEHTKSNGKWPCVVDFPINSMVIFHCYVSSPEGIWCWFSYFWQFLAWSDDTDKRSVAFYLNIPKTSEAAAAKICFIPSGLSWVTLLGLLATWVITHFLVEMSQTSITNNSPDHPSTISNHSIGTWSNPKKGHIKSHHISPASPHEKHWKTIIHPFQMAQPSLSTDFSSGCMFFGPGHPFFGPVHVFWT